MKFPKSWDDVLVRHYIALTKIKAGETLQSLPDILGSLGCDSSAVLKMRLEEALQIADGLKFLTSLPNGKPSPLLFGSLLGYKLQAFQYLSLGEFIDLDNLINKGLSDNTHQVSAVLYSDKESYDFTNRMMRAEKILDAPLPFVWPAVTDFIGYRLGVYKTYKGLFRMSDNENDPFYNAEEEERQHDEFSEKWGWFAYINRLAGDDITKHEQVLARGHIECFNQLSFFTERDARQNQRP